MRKVKARTKQAFQKNAVSRCRGSAKRCGKGFTMVELMTGSMISVIVVLGMGFVMADTQNAWNRTYRSVYADAVVDSYAARRAFDSVIRKAGAATYTIDDLGGWIEIRYYADSESQSPDRYARFYGAGSRLEVEHGIVEPRELLSTTTICENVSSYAFKTTGRSVQMLLSLDDGSRSVTLVACGYMHN